MGWLSLGTILLFAIVVAGFLWIPPALEKCEIELSKAKIVALGQTCVDNDAVSEDSELFQICYHRTISAKVTTTNCLHKKISEKIREKFWFGTSDEPPSIVDAISTKVLSIGMLLIMAYKSDAVISVVLSYLAQKPYMVTYNPPHYNSNHKFMEKSIVASN